MPVVLKLRQHYGGQLEQRGLTSIEAVSRYRVGDAHCLIGTILWRQRQTADALKECGRIHLDPEGKSLARQIRQALDLTQLTS